MKLSQTLSGPSQFGCWLVRNLGEAFKLAGAIRSRGFSAVAIGRHQGSVCVFVDRHSGAPHA